MAGWMLNDAERERLNGFPPEISQEDIIAFFTLSPSDINQIPKTASAGNRLGFIVQLCTLRFLGFCPDDLSSVPQDVLIYLAKQLEVPPISLSDYGERGQTRTDHLQVILAYLRFRKAGSTDMNTLSAWLLERVLEHDKPSLLLRQLCEKLYKEKIVRPGITVLERIIATSRSDAQTETFRRVSPLLTPERKKFLDNLLVNDEALKRTRHGWLIKGITSNTAPAMLFSLEKLAFLRKEKVDQWDMSSLTPNRLKFLSQIAKRSTNQALQRMSEEKRYPILLALLNQLLFEVTDETIEIFDYCLWDCYNGAKHDLEDFKKEVYKSSNEKLTLLQEVSRLVLDPTIKDLDLRETIFKHYSQEELQSVVEECAKIIRPTNDKYFDFLSTRYSYLQQFVPTFLNSFCFHSNVKGSDLLEAVETLRQMNSTKQRKLPDDAPLDFLPDDWTEYVIDRDGKINKRYYAMSTLWELRSGLLSSNVWVPNSRRYANPETYLIPQDKWETMRTEVCQQMRVPENAQEFLAARRQELLMRTQKAEVLLKNKFDVRLENGKLVVPRLKEEEIPDSAKRLQDQITARLPRVDITDLVIEVGNITGFPDFLEHAAGAQPRSPDHLKYKHAVVLAQAQNLGLSQMAHAATLSYDLLSWYNTWYVREETLKKAFTAIVNKQYHQWLSGYWGDGTFSSSDGQGIITVGKNRTATYLPYRFGLLPGIMLFAWTSDIFAQYGTKPTRPTKRDSTFVLDEIVGNESELPLRNHTTDTAGFTELDFALFALLGRGYWPRLRDIGDQHLYRLAGMEKYPHVEQLFKGTINEKFIANNYDEMLRIAGSIQTGYVTASLFTSKLQARPQQNVLTQVLQEFGRLEKTIFILRYIQDPVFRREINLQLNKGEALHDLRQFVHFANEGKLRCHLEEDQINAAGCLNLVVNAIVFWNTIYMQAIIEQLRREGYQVNDEDLKHLSPARFEHIHPYGHFVFNIEKERARKGLRPLRHP